MQLLQSLLPNVNLLRLDSHTVETDELSLILHLSSTQTRVKCPVCGGLTARIHSRYERTLADLPCMNLSLKLIVQVCKFFCPNEACHRRVFTERLPEVAAPWARKTIRFIQRLQSVGLALGGSAGSRLGPLLGYASSGSTLLNHLQRLPLPKVETPKILGVDDFAFRKGHHYGTILVNLDTHQPIELLPDRKAETLAAWLVAHPGIEVISRDRSKTYRSAIDKAAPDAVQVADRFHLVKNLSGHLEQALSHYRTELKAAKQEQHSQLIAASPEETVIAVPQSTATKPAKKSSLEHHQRRVEQQRTMRELRAKGWPNQAIAQEVGVGLRTVERYLSAPDFPETPPRRATFGKGVLDPYKQQLLAWWNDGIREPSVLTQRLRQEGYEGSTRTVQRYIKGLRHAQGLPPIRVKVDHPLPRVIDPQAPPMTSKQAAYFITRRPEHREPEEAELLALIVQQHPDLALLLKLADTFLELLREQQADGFDEWLTTALASPFKSLKTFAKGLLDDYAAVKASMMTSVSNGPVEGLNNKLKMLKRQMFGRAGLDLLAKRFVLG